KIGRKKRYSKCLRITQGLYLPLQCPYNDSKKLIVSYLDEERCSINFKH
ncbi:MAG: hypothetical protein ACI9JY_002477, partial [Saprospiraceae bacterium]